MSFSGWQCAFWATDALQGLLVPPRMWSCSPTTPFKLFTVSYSASIVLDGIWHYFEEKEDVSLSTAGVCYMLGTLPFVYRFFVSKRATRKTKILCAILYAVNFYTFGDPKDVSAPYFLHKHLANHLGSTLFFYVACTDEYQLEESTGSGGEGKKSN